MSEFHPGDPVVNIKTGKSFIVGGMKRGLDGRLLFCGEGADWTEEKDLDYDISEVQKEALLPVEHIIHSLRSNANDLTARLLLLKNDFGGHLPKPVLTEIEAVILMLRSHLHL